MSLTQLSYYNAERKYQDVKGISLPHPAGVTFDADGNSAVEEVGDYAVARLTLTCTDFNPTSLDVTVQGSQDGGSNWFTIGTFTQLTDVGAETKVFPTARHMRVVYNHEGSGDITAGVSGEVA